MVWMPLLNKKNMRRRSSQSPSSSSDSSPKVTSNSNRTFFGSKHKRRILLKRDSTVTEASSLSSRGSVQTDSAPWRVENIRERPPTTDEWWEDVGAPDTIDVYPEVTDDNTGDDGSPKVVMNARVSSHQKKFHNCGFETWIRAREEWKQQTVETVPEKPALLERAQILKGIRKATTQRTYELPRNVALPDMIRIYNDIWDGDGH
mmetsp:Transcript_11996/g.34368  ORF Transcript_11996/g.34368 Transcript_11996/m.34368 type:complete len:204 (+) Transcript_11996:114-725(+)